jgi:hypothetical protein
MVFSRSCNWRHFWLSGSPLPWDIHPSGFCWSDHELCPLGSGVPKTRVSHQRSTRRTAKFFKAWMQRRTVEPRPSQCKFSITLTAWNTKGHQGFKLAFGGTPIAKLLATIMCLEVSVQLWSVVQNNESGQKKYEINPFFVWSFWGNRPLVLLICLCFSPNLVRFITAFIDELVIWICLRQDQNPCGQPKKLADAMEGAHLSEGHR